MVDGTIDEIMDVSKKYLVMLSENKIRFTRAYLFGSYLRGDHNKFSDIDIAIFSEKWS